LRYPNWDESPKAPGSNRRVFIDGLNIESKTNNLLFNKSGVNKKKEVPATTPGLPNPMKNYY
jgi:hypothetical protein